MKEEILRSRDFQFRESGHFEDTLEAMENYAEFKQQELLKEIIGEIDKMETGGDKFINTQQELFKKKVLNILNNKLNEDGDQKI